MEKTIKAVGFSLTAGNNELIEKKLQRLTYADEHIVNLTMTVKYDKTFKVDTTVNFKWGAQAHVSTDDADFAAAVNMNVDTLDAKVSKEKEKYVGR